MSNLTRESVLSDPKVVVLLNWYRKIKSIQSQSMATAQSPKLINAHYTFLKAGLYQIASFPGALTSFFMNEERGFIQSIDKDTVLKPDHIEFYISGFFLRECCAALKSYAMPQISASANSDLIDFHALVEISHLECQGLTIEGSPVSVAEPIRRSPKLVSQLEMSRKTMQDKLFKMIEQFRVDLRLAEPDVSVDQDVLCAPNTIFYLFGLIQGLVLPTKGRTFQCERLWPEDPLKLIDQFVANPKHDRHAVALDQFEKGKQLRQGCEAFRNCFPSRYELSLENVQALISALICHQGGMPTINASLVLLFMSVVFPSDAFKPAAYGAHQQIFTDASDEQALDKSKTKNSESDECSICAIM